MTTEIGLSKEIIFSSSEPNVWKTNLCPNTNSKLLLEDCHYLNSDNNFKGKVQLDVHRMEFSIRVPKYEKIYIPDRPLFIIQGDITFKRRQKVIAAFEATENSILICTQQSFKSSANTPSCNQVILESLQWNITKMEQFYFRFICLDSKGKTHVHFVTYDESIERNLIALGLILTMINRSRIKVKTWAKGSFTFQSFMMD